MFRLKIKNRVSTKKKKIHFDSFSKIFNEFHVLMVNAKNEMDVNIGFEFETDIDKEFYISFYALEESYIDVIEDIAKKYQSLSYSKIRIDLDLAQDFYYVKKSKGINDKWTTKRLKDVIDFVLENIKNDFKLGSRAYYVKKLILSTKDFSIEKKYDYIKDFQGKLRKNDHERFLPILSLSTKQNFNLFINKLNIEKDQKVTFKSNSYGLSFEDDKFLIPVI